MNPEKQHKLIAKYQELISIYNVPNVRPTSNDQKDLRCWYRSCVLDCNTLVDILEICERLIADDSEDAEDHEVISMGNQLLFKLRAQLAAQRSSLESTAGSLGLTAPEWD